MAQSTSLKRVRSNLEYVQNIVHGLLWILLLGFLWKRLYYCVDLTDESLYTALPVSFFRGARPYLDELLIVQNSGIFLKPLVSLYSLFHPDLSGIVLFFRQSYFFGALLSTFGAFIFLRKYLNGRTGLWGATFLMTFVPFAIPSLSYNTLFELLALLGILLVTNSNKGKFQLPVGAFCCLTAGCIYPTIFPFISMILLYASYYSWKKKGMDTAFILTVGIGVLFLVLVVVILANIGLPRIGEMVHYTLSMGMHSGGWSKVLKILGQIWDARIFYVAFTLFLLALPFAFRIKFAAPVLALALIYFSYRYCMVDGLLNHYSMTALSLAPVLLIYFVKRNLSSGEFSSLSFLWLASMVLGVGTAVTSGNGMINQPLGAMAGVMVAVVFIGRLASSGKERDASLCFMILCFAMVGYLWLQHYGDDDAFSLNSRVASGPYRGLNTTNTKSLFLATLQADLEKSERGLQTIASFDSAAAVYLSSTLAPCAATVWSYFSSQLPSDRQMLADYYTKNQVRPDLLVWMHELPIATGITLKRNAEADPVKNLLINESSVIQVERPWYTIYRLK